MFIDDRGLVLQTVRYDDEASVVHVYTCSHGGVPFVVRRPTGRASRERQLALTPITFLRFQWEHKPTATLHRMRDAHPLSVWRTLNESPSKSAICLMLAEFLSYALRQEGPSEPLFDYLLTSFQWLDEAPSGFASFHLLLMLKTARFLGIAPTAEELRHSTPSLSDEDVETLLTIARGDCADLATLPLSGADRSRLSAAIVNFYRLHAPDFPPLKSLAVVETLFR